MTTTGSTASVFASYKDAAQHVSQAILHKGDGRPVVKCGNLACQHNSFQATLGTSSLLSYAIFEERAAPKKKSKNSKKEKETNLPYSTTMYALSLSDSVFFPEGGGQPADRGTITINGQKELQLRVLDAQNINNICVLTCQPPKESSQETVQKALTSGATIKQEIDWNRRFDLMTQHSAQHLVSAVALNEFNLDTNSFSLQQSSLTSYIDFTVDPNTDIEQHHASLRVVEEIVNERIRENLPMAPKWLDPDDPEFKAKVRSRLLPAGLTGKIRLVEIDGGGLDCNTCCGTHVPTLGSLQMVKFFKLEKVKGTIVRVHFAAGKRLLQMMERSFDRQAKFTNLLSCNEEEHVARLSQLLDDKRAKEREIKALNEEVCELKKKEIVKECNRNDGVAVLHLGTSADMAFMQMLSAAVIGTIGSSAGVLLLFVGAVDEGDNGIFLLSGDVELVDKVGKRTAELLGGRGGGKNGKFQGKGTKVKSGLPAVKQYLMSVRDS